MKSFLFTLLLYLLSVSSSLAQVPPPPDYHENAVPGAPSALPVDQYLYYLIGVALTIAIYFIWKRKKLINQF